MGLGGTAKKLQKVVDIADELYEKLNDLREEVTEARNSIDETKDRVGEIEDELAEQRALLEKLAETEGVDLPVAEASEAEPNASKSTDEA